MSILIDRDTRLVVQGITGREGEFHSRAMLEYGTNIVAGMTPGTFAARYAGATDFLPIVAPADCGFLQDRENAVPA